MGRCAITQENNLKFCITLPGTNLAKATSNTLFISDQCLKAPLNKFSPESMKVIPVV